MPKQAMSAHMDVDLNTTSEIVQNFLAKHPKDARFKAVAHQGDRPWESGWITIELSWSEEI